MNPTHPDALSWDIDIPLLTNAHMLRSMLIVTVGSATAVAALLSLVLALQGEGRIALQLLGLFAAGGLGFFVLSLLVMLGVLGNRFQARFTVDEQGVRYETRDRAAKAGHRGALVLGLLMGRPSAVGSGLLARAQEHQALRWTGAFHAEPDPIHHTIALRNRWRTLLMLYCTPDNYAAVQALLSEQMAQHRTAGGATGRSPLAGYLLRTVGVVLACVPLFLLGPVYGHGPLLPLLLLCFAAATVWLVRYLAWVVLGSAAVLLVSMGGAAVAVRGSSSLSGVSYSRYEMLSADAWALTLLAGAGLIYLVWLAVQSLRRRIKPALEADMLDAAGQ